MAEIREKVRDSAEARFFAMETLRGCIEWIKTTNPQTYLVNPGETKKSDDVLSTEEIKTKMRDWVNKSGDLIEASWDLPGMLVSDAIRILKEREGERAEQETAPESK